MPSCRVSHLLLLALGLIGQPVAGRAAPHLQGIHPVAGQRGTSVNVEVQGAGLDGAYAVWFGPETAVAGPVPANPAAARVTTWQGGLQGEVRAVEHGSRARVRLAIGPDVPVGMHALRLVSPRGLSNAVTFWVAPHAVVEEQAGPHDTPDTAQAVAVPVAVYGRLPEHGQVDYYRFAVEQEQTLAFTVVAKEGATFDPQLALYDTTASWLDPHRGHRLVFEEERTQGSAPRDRRLTYHFTKPGRYVIGVASVLFRGGGDFAYLLRIAPPDEPAPPDARTWACGRLTALAARSTNAAPAVAASVPVIADREPNDTPAHGPEFTLPAVLDGTIGHPGDLDCYRFRAAAGRKIALDIDTPHARPPQFNPRVEVLDPAGKVVLTNLHFKQGNVDALAESLTGVLKDAGVYCVRVRDLTSIHGSPDHRYRVLVRDALPHVGVIGVKGDECLNLAPGGSQTRTLALARAEGFAGDFALAVDGLPPGVTALFSTSGPAIVFHADADAPATLLPKVARVSGRPMVAGKLGPRVDVRDVPVMVLRR